MGSKKKQTVANTNMEASFRELIENLSEGIVTLDKSWQVVFLNRKAEQILNRPAGQLVGKVIWDVFPNSVGTPFYLAYHKAMDTQESIFIEDYSRALNKWTRAAVYPSPNGLSIYFHDITQQKKAEDKAIESEAQYKTALERITDGFIALDKNFCYVYVNQKVCDLVHRDAASLIGKNVWEVFPEAVGSDTYKAFQTAMKEQRFISNIDYYPPLNLWQENYIYPSQEGLSIFIKDISDRKKLEKELREQERNQQFEIMITALEAQEKERTHIGQELHDNVNQLLVATKLMLALVRDHPGKKDDLVPGCIDNLDRAIEENRKISHELVSPDLHQSLVEQLHFLLQTMLAPHGIDTRIKSVGFDESLLNKQKKLAIYRIAQEQCTNIIKYARASRVSFSLATNGENFSMTITDNGKGMDPAIGTTGIGLRNIEGRVAFFNGTATIETKPGEGFTLAIQMPIDSGLAVVE